MFIDEVEIEIQAGNGGDGAVSFGKMSKSGPDGGNGGKGGDIYIVGINDITALSKFSAKTKWTAENGQRGEKNKRTGKDADDMTIEVPIGTSLYNLNTNEFLFEVDVVGQSKVIAYGGGGGKGNWEFRSPTLTTPKFAEKGRKGQYLRLKLILKLIADFGFVGLPNTGKSSLLNNLTRSHAKVGNYAFTTLAPNLGVYNNKIIADIPGLIDGASAGRGLGISFLKHIEKVKTILHCISCDTTDPIADYVTVRKELSLYNKELLKKDEIILLTKSDLADAKAVNSIAKKFKNKKIVHVSIYDPESLENIRKILR